VNDLLVSSKDFSRFHSVFFDAAPEPGHIRLYDAFPHARGISDRAQNETTFEAVLIMALVQTFPKNQQLIPFKCYFFVPASIKVWAETQLTECAKRMFEGLKRKRNAAAAKHLGTFFHNIPFGSRVLQINKAPDRWVAFGFTKGDLIPDWFGAALLDPEA
jgi:hypothetical protein